MKINTYISYWDQFTQNWINSPDNTLASCMYHDKYERLFRFDVLPEPYWGNPKECSIAVLNFNPGPVDLDVSCIFKDIVSGTSYNELAKDFPYLLTAAPAPLNGIIGREGNSWWLSFKEWTDRLYQHHTPTDLPPFAIELCPWHSDKWKVNCKSKSFQNNFKQYLEDYVIDIFRQAIQNSIAKFGICVGKPIGDILEWNGFQEKEIKCQYYIPNAGLKPTHKERYYRIYESKGVKVLNTWANGTNQHPAPDYQGFERELVNKYIYGLGDNS